MRILHLADLHIGKRVNDFSMIEDQRYILTKVLNLIDEKNINVVLMAGDIYDKAIPVAEGVTLLSDFLNKLSKKNVEVYITSGNHDSAERMGFGSELIALSKIYISKPFSGEVEKYTTEDENGKINVYMLPFIKPIMVKRYFENQEINTYDDAVKAVIDSIELNETERNIIISHQFVSGATRSESEDISVGGIDEVSFENYEKFDYVALGHLHRPQSAGADHIRYAGTLLPYSLSEVDHEKTVPIIELGKKGEIDISFENLTPLRAMREIKGTYMEITEKKYYEEVLPKQFENFSINDYFHIILTDEDDIPGAMGKLRSIYPNLMKLDYDNARTNAAYSYRELEDVDKKNPLQLFEEFYEMRNGVELSDEQKEYIIELMDSVGIGGEE